MGRTLESLREGAKDGHLGVFLSRGIFHLCVEPNGRVVADALSVECPLWGAAVEVEDSLVQLDAAWRRVVMAVETAGGFALSPVKALLDSPVEKTVGTGAWSAIDAKRFQRLYYELALSSACGHPGCDGDLCTGYVSWSMERRYPSVAATAQGVRGWERLLAPALRGNPGGVVRVAVSLLFSLHTVMFVGDLVESESMQKYAQFVLTLCEERLLYAVNHGVDDVSRNAKTVYQALVG